MAHQPGAPTQELAPDLERAGDLPVGAQLGWRLRVLIASGQLGPGDRLPGVRELASGTGVNVNTARAVYRRLEDEGLIVSRHGLGTFVAEGAPASPDLERLAAEAAESARASGVDPRDLARAIYAGSVPSVAPVATSGLLPAEPPQAEPLAADGDERLGRRELRRQIARLEAQLASYPAEARKPGEPTHPLLRPKGHVADMAELEAIRDELMERLKRARGAAERRGERATARPRPPRGDGERPGRSQVGDGFQAGSRRARLRERGGAAALGTGRGADELVASKGLVGVSVSRAADGVGARARVRPPRRRPMEGGENGPIRCR